MSREADELALEISYWKLVLEDLGELNGLLERAAGVIAGGAVGLIPLAMLVRTEADVRSLGALSDASRSSLDLLRQMQTPLGRMIDLAGGRGTALRAEFEGESADA